MKRGIAAVLLLFAAAASASAATKVEKRTFLSRDKQIPGHTHDDSSKSSEINAQVWDLFSRTRMEADPRFRVYAEPKPAP